MSAPPTRFALIALLLAALLGAAIGGISHLSAVGKEDPIPSGVAVPIRTPDPRAPSPVPTTAASPTQTPSATATPEPEPEPEVWLYTVQVGDSISGIAIRFGSTTGELLDLNPEYEDNQNLVEAGSEFIVPCTPIARTEDRC